MPVVFDFLKVRRCDKLPPKLLIITTCFNGKREKKRSQLISELVLRITFLNMLFVSGPQNELMCLYLIFFLGNFLMVITLMPDFH